MNTDSPDPLFRSLDRLAQQADTDAVPDRMADISRRARQTRQRKLAAGGAGIAVLAAIAAGALIVPDRGTDGTAPDPAGSPSQTPSKAVREDADLSGPLRLRASAVQSGEQAISVRAEVLGTGHSWSSGTEEIGEFGARAVTFAVDGGTPEALFGGSELGAVDCRRGSSTGASQESYGTPSDNAGQSLQVSGYGEHTVKVVASVCGPDGPAELTETLTVKTSRVDYETADELNEDLDGDGEPESIAIDVPAGSAGDPDAAIAVARLSVGDAAPQAVFLPGLGEPVIEGVADLNGDGSDEVVVRKLGGANGDTFSVLNLRAEIPYLVTVTGMGEALILPNSTGVQDAGSADSQVTGLRTREDGSVALSTWFGGDRPTVQDWRISDDQMKPGQNKPAACYPEDPNDSTSLDGCGPR